MKHTILVLALINGAAAQAAMIAPTRVHLPGVRAPQISINPRIQLPTPTIPVLSINAVKLAAPAVVPAAPIVLPGAFNPNSPITFPTSSNEGTGKVVAKLGELFDGSAAKEAPAVPAGDVKGEKAPVEKAPVIRAEKSDSHLTLPENDLLREIGF